MDWRYSQILVRSINGMAKDSTPINQFAHSIYYSLPLSESDGICFALCLAETYKAMAAVQK